MKTTLVATDLNKWLTYGAVRINRIYGRNDSTGGVDLYLLLFEAPTAAASAVPSVAPLTLTYGTWFDWEKCPINLKECYIALSTDANTLVAPAAGAGVELTIEYDTQYPVTTGVTILVGDLTTSVANRTIWANAAGPKTLYRLDVKNNSGIDMFAFISAVDGPLSVIKSTMQGPFPVADGTTKTLFFAYSPLEQLNGAIHDGCTVFLSELPAIGSDIYTSADFNIRGVYGA